VLTCLVVVSRSALDIRSSVRRTVAGQVLLFEVRGRA
jgi:hypothetical protein